MADACLVSLPTIERAQTTIVPHWMLWLSAYIERMGYTADFVDVKCSGNSQNNKNQKESIVCETLDRIKRSNSPIVGLSGFTQDYEDLVETAHRIRKITDAKIVVGGIHATVSPLDFFEKKDTPFDAVIVGDGEIPLTQMIEAQKDGHLNWENINGLIYRDGDRVVQAELPACSPEIINMPPLPYHKLDLNFYLRPQQSLVRWIYLSGVHLFTARGCPYSCTFCANSRKTVRYRSIDTVIEEIRTLKETYDIDGFYIHDDTFTIKTDRVIEFCEKLLTSKLNLVWGMEGRVNQFPEKLFSLLKRSGCIQIDFGVESGSQESLNRMRKGIKVEHTEDVFHQCYCARIRTFANILINTPEETEDDVNQTISLMEKIKASEYGIGITTPLPGTEIYQQYVKPPLTIAEYEKYKKRQTYISIVDPRFHMAVHDLDMSHLLMELQDRFVNNKRWKFFSLQPIYLKAILKSKRKSQYFSIFFFRLFRRLKNIIKQKSS